jgi:hypothetical protein
MSEKDLAADFSTTSISRELAALLPTGFDLTADSKHFRRWAADSSQ